MEIKFSEIHPQDQLLIRTANSEYRFCVTNAEQRRGRLTGGSLGDSEREAVLAGAATNTGGLGKIDQTLQPGGRAVFYLSAQRGVERLITSVIRQVALNHTHDSGRQAA